MLIGLPATVAPLTWSCGFLPEALGPASWMSAYWAPENDSPSNVANGPPQVVSTPILMAPAGADAGAAALEEPLDTEFCSEPPHATSASAAAVSTTAALPGVPCHVRSQLLEFRIDAPAPRAEGRREPLHLGPTDNRLAIPGMIGI